MANPKKTAVESKASAKGVAKPAVKPAAQKAKEPVEAAAPAVETIKVKELVAAVAANSSAKKPEVKAMVEAVLTEIGAALDKGAELNLPGLGRLKVVKSIEKGEANQLTLKLKRSAPKATEK